MSTPVLTPILPLVPGTDVDSARLPKEHSRARANNVDIVGEVDVFEAAEILGLT
jgi:hypothetical protein